MTLRSKNAELKLKEKRGYGWWTLHLS